MKGRTLSVISSGFWPETSSYVQINIYDTNLEALQERGIDIKNMLENIGCRSIIMDVPILVPRVEGCTAGKCHNDSQEELPGHQPTPNALDLTYHLIYGKAKSSSVRAMTLKSKGFSATKETMNRSSCSERRCDDTLPVTRLQSAGADECSQAVERHTFVSVADPLDQTMRAAECSSSWPPSEASEEAAQDEKPVTVFSEADYSALRWQSVEESGSLFFDPGNVNDSDSRGSQSMSDALAKLKIPAAPEVSVDKYQSITDVPDSPLNEPKGFTRLKTVCQSDILNVLAQRSSSLCVEQLPSEPLEQKADAEENIEKRSPSPKRQRCQEPAEHCDPVVEREEFDVGKNANTGKSKDPTPTPGKQQETQFFQCQFQGCFKSLKWYPKMGRSRLVEHARAHWKKKVKKCKICGYTATDVRTVHRHHTLKHGTEPFMGAISNETKEDWDELEQCYKKCFPGESSRSGTFYYTFRTRTPFLIEAPHGNPHESPREPVPTGCDKKNTIASDMRSIASDSVFAPSLWNDFSSSPFCKY